MEKNNKITLNVVQGVGDTFWVYQKFSPYFDEINFNIINVLGRRPEADVISMRAAKFLHLLPKVNKIGSIEVPLTEYNRVVQTRYDMRKILENPTNEPVEYACNQPLEQGVRINEIDEGLKFEETVDIPYFDGKLPFAAKRYLLVYMAAAVGKSPLCKEPWGIWKFLEWMQFIETVSKNYDGIVLVGAHWDGKIANITKNYFEIRKKPIHLYLNESWVEVNNLIRNAGYFIGYQSGLSVIADQYDVPQCMFYLNNLESMKYSWPKQRNIDNKFFKAYCFKEGINHVTRETIRQIEYTWSHRWAAPLIPPKMIQTQFCNPVASLPEHTSNHFAAYRFRGVFTIQHTGTWFVLNFLQAYLKDNCKICQLIKVIVARFTKKDIKKQWDLENRPELGKVNICHSHLPTDRIYDVLAHQLFMEQGTVVFTLRDPMLSLISRQNRYPNLQHFYIIEGFKYLATLGGNSKAYMLPLDLHKTFEERKAYLERLLTMLKIPIEQEKMPIIEAWAKEWKSVNSAQDKQALKTAYNNGDLAYIRQAMPEEFDFLMSNRDLLVPFLQSLGYKDLKWW